MNKIIGSLASIILLFLSVVVQAEDSHNHSHSQSNAYTRIIPAQPTQSVDKIEVLEVFWYGCSHCYDFEPYVKKWLATKPDDVDFRRMPGIFSKNWVPHARAFFTAQKLGVLDKIHTPLFKAIHQDRKRVHTEEALKDFFVSLGIDGNEFTKVYNSSEIETKFKQAFVMGQRYKLTGVPAVIINGKYMTSSSLAGSYDHLLKVIDDLVAKERWE